MKLVFELVEYLASNQIWIGLCGFGVIIVPILGIQYLYNNHDK
jgi:hypothetical protein